MSSRAPRTEHFVFLIEADSSARYGGVLALFSRLYPRVLDDLMRRCPYALVSLITFDKSPHLLYSGQEVRTTLPLPRNNRTGKDLPRAICDGLGWLVSLRSSREDITAFVITGPTPSTVPDHDLGSARDSLSALRRRGVRLLCFSATEDAGLVGFQPDEIHRWNRSRSSLAEAISRGIGSLLPEPDPCDPRLAVPCSYVTPRF